MNFKISDPKEFKIFCIPYHVVQFLKSKDLTLADLDKEVVGLESLEVGNKIASILIDNVSRDDYKDVVISNKFGENYLNISTFDLDHSLDVKHHVYVSEQDTADFINLYSDQSVDIKSIIMSNSPDTKVPFKIISFDSTVFLVLEKGITNFVLYNVKSFNLFFIQVVLNHMFKMFGEEFTYGTDIFASFNKLQNYI